MDTMMLPYEWYQNYMVWIIAVEVVAIILLAVYYYYNKNPDLWAKHKAKLQSIIRGTKK